MDFGQQLPDIRVSPPGPASRALAERLRAVESRNVTWLADDFPVFWTEALGANVLDADGNRYLDLTAAFGVALTGHRDPGVASAIRAQADRLVHGMGDVHPSEAKVELLERLAGLMPWDESRSVLASSGSEAVEAALKTAQLATGRPGILTFHGGYHGLTLGSLAATARPYFRRPFDDRLYRGVVRAPFPTADRMDEALEAVATALRDGAPNGDPIGAVVVEPVQARGGVRVMPPGAGRALTALAREHGALLIADEIFTGLGRCGAVLASPGAGLEPDLVCLGKVLGGGLPLSACVGSARVMGAWPESPGEALHTSTFLGHPLACAAGVAVLDAVAAGLPERVAVVGDRLRDALQERLAGLAGVSDVRGRGLLLGFDRVDGLGRPMDGGGADLAVAALGRGLIVLPAGDAGEVVELSPPACLTPDQIDHAADVLGELAADPAEVPA